LRRGCFLRLFLLAIEQVAARWIVTR
jgi:hypothetical protein